MKTDLYLVLLVGAGGFIGAILRYLISGTVAKDDFPYGTLVVNILGSFLLGVLIFTEASTGIFSGEWRTFLGIGVLGAFTTMSAFNAEGMDLLSSKENAKFAFNLMLNVGVGLLAVYLGRLTALSMNP